MSTTLTRTREIARGHWPRILRSFGLAVDYLMNRHGPCPICGGVDRYRFDNKNGNGTFYCNRCGAGDGIKLVMAVTSMGFQEAIEAIVKAAGGDATEHTARIAKADKRRNTDTSVQQVMAMSRLWNAGADTVAGDPVGLYLASRGVGVSPRLQNIRTLVGSGGTTMMLARVQKGSHLMEQPAACQLHRTILPAGDFTRERKMMPGMHPEGSAVRLYDVGDRKTMGIAEGIETAMSAATMFQLPVWAALTAGRLATFVPPPGVKFVRIFADFDLPDMNGHRAGMDAAIKLARALDAGGVASEIELPPQEGTDWNDVLADFMTRAVDAGAVNAVPEGTRMYFRGVE